MNFFPAAYSHIPYSSVASRSRWFGVLVDALTTRTKFDEYVILFQFNVWAASTRQSNISECGSWMTAKREICVAIARPAWNNHTTNYIRCNVRKNERLPLVSLHFWNAAVPAHGVRDLDSLSNGRCWCLSSSRSDTLVPYFGLAFGKDVLRWQQLPFRLFLSIAIRCAAIVSACIAWINQFACFSAYEALGGGNRMYPKHINETLCRRLSFKWDWVRSAAPQLIDVECDCQ